MTKLGDTGAEARQDRDSQTKTIIRLPDKVRDALTLWGIVGFGAVALYIVMVVACL